MCSIFHGRPDTIFHTEDYDCAAIRPAISYAVGLPEGARIVTFGVVTSLCKFETPLKIVSAANIRGLLAGRARSL